jgi:hypothetical protein
METKNTFLKLMSPDKVRELVKEAKRVKYTVEGKLSESFLEVTDPDYANVMVFRGVEVRRGVWSVSFSKLYWQSPE